MVTVSMVTARCLIAMATASQAEMPATVSRLDDGRAEIVFADAQTVAAAPGQSEVFYDGDSVVVGGIIE